MSAANQGFLEAILNSLKIVPLRSFKDVAPLRAQIDTLNLASRRPCPFSTYAYIETFLAHDEEGTRDAEVLFLTAFQGDELVGFLPLRKHRDSLLHVPFHKVDVLVAHDTDRPHVVARPDDEARCADAFYRFLLEREHGWSFLELAMQDADSSLREVPHLDPMRFYARKFDTMPNTTVPLTYPSFAEYFNVIAGSQRKNMARLSRKLIAAGVVEVVASSDARAREALLELYLDLERRSWKEAAHAGIRRSPRRIAFFRALCAPNAPFEMGFDFVLLDGLPIAGLVSRGFEGTLHGLETCFDREYEDLGPGHLLTLMSIRRAMDDGYRAINFNGNYAYYKASIGGVVTETSAVQIYKVGRLPWLKARAGEIKRRLRPVGPNGDRFNPARRAVSQDGADKKSTERPPRSARTEERELARTTLQKLEQSGVALSRISGVALEHALPFSTRRGAA